MKRPLRILYLEDDIRHVALVQDALAADRIACEVRQVETETASPLWTKAALK
jgi:hypothetical protein